MAALAALPTIAQVFIGGVASSMLSNALAPKQNTPTAPTATPPTPMPTADDATVQAAKQKSIASQLAQRGRASTILTDTANGSPDKLGG